MGRLAAAAIALIGFGLMTAVVGPAGAAAAEKPAAAAVGDYPRPPSDPAAVARGKQAFSVNCAFCHGSGARGGESGPNLLRSPLVLNDQKGEVIGAFIQVGRPEKGMPRFNLSADSAADIAAFLHSIRVGRSEAAFDPNSIVVGKAAAGKAFFNGAGHCSRCHSLNGDFAHIGSRLDAKTLQDNIVSGGATSLLGFPLPTAPPQTVMVTPTSGAVVTGTLVDVDDFHVTLIDTAGNRRTFLRDGPSPQVEIHNPLQAHLDRVREWDDADLHNVTAFLKSQK